MSGALKDILKMLWESKELIISLITLYLIIWFNKIPRIKDREEILRDRLMRGELFRPVLKTRLGTFSTYFVQMRELRGYRYWLKKLFLWKVEGHTMIAMRSNTPCPFSEDQLLEIKKIVERELKVKIDFQKLEDGLKIGLVIPSIDPDKCTDVWLRIGQIIGG
jgi:hypothetical protein